MATTHHKSTQEPPVELPLDHWLYDFKSSPNCGVCVALVREFDAAKGRDDSRKMYECAAEIRNHEHGQGVQ